MAVPQLVMPLQTQCLTVILHHLEEYPTELLCLLPTRQRRELLMSLPPLDICKLEQTDFVREVDTNSVWQAICKLYGETDNIRVTGNRNFDTRYLNYSKKSETVEYKFFDHTEKVRGDWRAHFLTRTAQILLHSSDPALLPVSVQHSDRCECSHQNIPEQVESECDCWGGGVDPAHRAFLLRLTAVPPQSKIAQLFSKLSRRTAHFTDVWEDEEARTRFLLVPFRHADYFADGFKPRALDLLSMLVRECVFRPRLLPVHCEFMHFGELFQIYLAGSDHSDNTARAVFVDFLSEVEQVEFYWVGGLKGVDKDGKNSYAANPAMHIPKVVLEAVLVNPSPKLDTLSLRVYSIDGFQVMDSCLEDLAPFFSPLDAKNCKSKLLPISTPYSGLRKIHIFGNIASEKCADVVSSAILHQSAIEGLELMCISKFVHPSYLLDPIVSIFSLPQFQYLAFRTWQFCDLKDIFCQFLDSNCNYEIHAIATGHEVVIPARNGGFNPPRRKHLCFASSPADSSLIGKLFVWLDEARLEVPLLSVTIKFPTQTSGLRQQVAAQLRGCHALSLEYKRSVALPDKYLEALSTNPNLKTLKLHNCSFAFDKFCNMLGALYANCPELKELSFQNNKLSTLPPEKLRLLFKRLFSHPKLQQLSLDLRYNNLKDEDVDALVEVWEEGATLSRLNSLTLDTEQHQSKVEEMVLDY